MALIKYHNYAVSGRAIAPMYSRGRSGARHAKTHEHLLNAEYQVSISEGTDGPALAYVTFSPHSNKTVGPDKKRTAELKVRLARTPKGIFVHEIQSDGFFSSPAELTEPTRTFLDTKVGASIALEALKHTYPGESIHVVAPHEVKGMWGKDSTYVLAHRGFVSFLKERYPLQLRKLLIRLGYEHGQIVLRRNSRQLPDGLVAGVLDELDALKAKRGLTNSGVPGTKLLRKAATEYANERRVKGVDDGDTLPLGKRRSRGYYSTVPLKHGFGDVHLVDFGKRIGRHYVRTYNPKEPLLVIPASEWKKLPTEQM